MELLTDICPKCNTKTKYRISMKHYRGSPSRGSEVYKCVKCGKLLGLACSFYKVRDGKGKRGRMNRYKRIDDLPKDVWQNCANMALMNDWGRKIVKQSSVLLDLGCNIMSFDADLRTTTFCYDNHVLDFIVDEDEGKIVIDYVSREVGDDFGLTDRLLDEYGM